MGFQQFDTSSGLHLTTDNTGKILFDGQFVDSRNLIGLNHQLKRAQEHLRLLALPMEIDSNGDIIERKRCICLLGHEGELTVLIAIPQNSTFAEFNHLFTFYLLTFGCIGSIQREVNLLSTDNTHRYRGFFLHFYQRLLVFRVFQLLSHLLHLLGS